jgi:hypothetical protein
MVGELNFAILDPNTPAKTAASFDVGGAYMEGQQNALARQGARQTQQMNALSLQKAQNAMADEATMKGVYARGGDIGAGLQGAGFGKEALDYKTKMQTSETATLTQQKLKIEALQKGIETTAQLMSGANDQASWSAMKQAAAQHLPPEAIANIPDRFDPALRDDLVMKSLPVKDQLANQWKALDQQLRQDEFSYRQQNDAANRGVTLRGQNMSAEKSPYFTPVQTAQGVMSFNARTGRMEPVVVEGGKVVGSTSDPDLQKKIAEGKARGKEAGEVGEKAKIELPGHVQEAENTIKLVDDLLAHPGFKQAVGSSSMLGVQKIPGTAAASFKIAEDQLKGKQFLQAFNSLRGGGQITEAEGKKATDSISRMNSANTEDEYKKAAREFQGIIRQGVDRAKKKAGEPSGTVHPDFPGFSIGGK